MARPRAANYGDQRAAILTAAAAVFARRGYTAATMNEVAAACGIGKATLYHYVADKSQLLEQIALDHVARLESLIGEVSAARLPPAEHLGQLIRHFMAAYAGAQHEHRVLTEDVKFLADDARQRVEDAQRRVVRAYVQAIAAVRPGSDERLQLPLAMLLFGMINWTFTWLRPDGPLTHEQLGEVVVQLLEGGLPAVRPAA